MADRMKLTDERIAAKAFSATRLSVECMNVGVAQAGMPPPSRTVFRALDGTVRVVLEADNEAEARAICAEHGFEFIALCDDEAPGRS